ncbi:hypothetical protein G5B30_03700 [Sphingobacterium sp. SGG-5]|uniref:hypothetical protein n=1 Tax=Sphingobacterium sp. SGG-5 TaxID=2710881 RepID=UPI0013EB24DE|nr:hypothetical protein [Sphingobacterium sp. SGG-5]NGM61017.1 hypothetical protein [Sphingobacterium sp. SGG-5]
MSKTRIFALVTIGIILAAILSNPSRQEFETVLTAKAKEILKKQLEYQHDDAVQLGMTLFGDKLVHNFVENNMVIKNYYLFSLIYIKWQGEETPIGGGVFKQIWLSPKIDEKVNDIIHTLKSL